MDVSQVSLARRAENLKSMNSFKGAVIDKVWDRQAIDARMVGNAHMTSWCW